MPALFIQRVFKTLYFILQTISFCVFAQRWLYGAFFSLFIYINTNIYIYLKL